MKFARLTVLVLLVLALGPVSCAPTPGDQPGDQAGGTPQADGAVRFAGLFDAAREWTADDLLAMETKVVQSTDKAGKTVTFSGVALSALLESMQLKDDAETLTFEGSDGYTADVAISEIEACTDCIIAVQDDDTFMNVMPGFPANTQVRGLVSVEAK